MLTTELINILNEINKNEGERAKHTHIHIDSINSSDAENVVVELWESGDIDIYITDDADRLIENVCYEDEDIPVYGLKSVKVYDCRYDDVGFRVVF